MMQFLSISNLRYLYGAGPPPAMGLMPAFSTESDTQMEALLTLLDAVTPHPPETRVAIGALFSAQTLPRNAFFVQTGEVARQVAFVETGVLRAYASSATGQDYNKTFFVENDLFGIYYSLLTGQASHLSVQALTPCRLWVANYGAIVALYDQHPTLERFARLLAERLFVEKEQREIDLVLLDATARYEKFRRDYGDLEQRIPQYHIASCLGITPTQLSRIRAAK